MVIKENEIEIIKYIWYIVETVSLLMAPVVSHFMFEYVTGSLDTVPYYMAVLNIGWIYVLYLALLAVAGGTRITVSAASCALYVISLAETFVVAFRSRPIMLWDVMTFRTTMTTSGNYEFFTARQTKTAFVLLLLMNVFLWLTPRRVRGWKLRLAVGDGVAASIVGYGVWFFAVLVPSWGLGINMWAINGTYQEYGYVLSTAVSLQYVVKKPPQGYSNVRLKEIYNRLEESMYAEAGNGQTHSVRSQAYPESPENPEDPENRPEEGQPVTLVNLICIMNESLAELKTAGDFTANTEYFPFMDSLKENTVRGSFCMPMFGSMTSNTEFEFLTGDSMALLPANSIAYQFNVEPDTYSMVSTLKDQGYYSVAMHPYPGENWNRVERYRNMGFDAFLDQEFYEGSQELRNYVSDETGHQKLIQVVEAGENPGDKLFIFNVTMQNHGGYGGTYDNFEQEVWFTGEYEGKYPKTDQYLSLMKRSNQAFQYLVEYLSQIDEPTMIVMFGDHQPSVEDEFYDNIAGMPSSEITVQEHLMWYETPFIIWTNYSMPSEGMGRLGAVYLFSEVLWRANLEMIPYNRFLLVMKEDLPVVHLLGCYNREGTYYYWVKAESERCPCQDTVLNYEALVYSHSLDRKKFKELFVIDSENSISQ